MDVCLEKSLLQSADHVIANTPSNREYFVRGLRIHEGRATTITNGFDQHDFEGIIQPDNEKKGKFTMSYTGGFYAEYSPEFFFSALQELFRSRPTVRQQMKIIFAGRFLEGDSLIGKYKLNKIVELREHVPHHESIRLMLSSHVLLLFLPNRERSSNWVPGKTYEYMASGKPILAITPSGNLKELIEKSKTGFVADPADPSLIAETVYRLFCDYERKKTAINPDWHLINQFERRNLTETLSEVFNGLL